MTQIVIGIPGPWETQSDIVKAVALANSSSDSPRFLAAGGVIMDMQTQMSFGLDVYEHNDNLVRAFEYAGQGRFTDEELQLIDTHKHTVYIVCGEPFPSPPLEDLSAARMLLAIGEHMLKAGGFAVKVENSGLAHTAERWRYYARQATTLSVYDAFVTMVGADDFNYTCGMHVFGRPDVSVTTEYPTDKAPVIMNGFNQYQLLELPDLSDGHRFAVSEIDPVYTMTHRDYGYAESDLLNNPHGRWHLDLCDSGGSQRTPSFHESGDGLFMAIRKDDPKLLRSVELARESLPWFIDHFNSPYEYGQHLVKIYIQDGGESAYFWTILLDASDEGYKVLLFEIPPEFSNTHSGQKLVVKPEDVFDWSIERNATMIGGFSRRLQREHIPSEKRNSFDLRTGTISYAPLAEVLPRPDGARSE